MDQRQQITTITVPGPWNTLFHSSARERLERDILPGFLVAQRWFSSKARRLVSTRLIDWGPLPAAAQPVFLTFVQAEFGAGPPERYFLPLAFHNPEPICDGAPDGVIAQLQDPQGEVAWLLDAAASDDFGLGMLASIAQQDRFQMTFGLVKSESTSAFEGLRGAVAAWPAPGRPDASSSNTLLPLGERLLLKIFRQLEPGINPDLEIGRFLTEQTKFAAAPRLAGAINYQPKEDGEPTTLAILQEHVPHQGDGWTGALEDLKEYLNTAVGLQSLPQEEKHSSIIAASRVPERAEIRNVVGESLASAAVLGRRTAQMHLALGQDENNPAFAPEPMDGTDVELMVREMRTQAARAFGELEANRQALPVSLARDVNWLIAEGPARLDDVLSRRMDLAEPATKIRIHGDYHLGQVLRVCDDYVILDFEGEPARSLEYRRRKYSPIRDVAGMLRSYHYAAIAGALCQADGRGTALPELIECAEYWQRHVGAAFLRAYLETAGQASFIPRDTGDLEMLLNRFILEKALYELAYELNNRPDWTRIPISGLISLLKGPRT